MVVIPTYNERDNIAPLVERIQSIGNGIHILFVDDNSPDGTGQLANELSQRCNGISVIHRQKKLGLGTAYVEGFKFALERGYDYVIQMDADFSHDPKYIPTFMEKIKEYDLVLGSRYCNGISVVNWSLFRLILSFLACKYVKVITGLPFYDCLSGFKCFRKEVLEDINLDKVISDGYVFQMEMLYRAYKKGYRISEIPIIFVDRGFGRSKMSRRVIFEAFYKVPLLRFEYPISQSLGWIERHFWKLLRCGT